MGINGHCHRGIRDMYALPWKFSVVISIETINKMFEKNSGENHCVYQGRCHNCGCDLEIKITKTSGGYGLKGGVLYEPDPKFLWALCDDCHVKSSKLESANERPFTDAA